MRRAELLELAELLQAPVMMTQNGKGAISSRHYAVQNTVSIRELIAEADVIFVVGTRFLEASVQPWGPKGERTVIQLDIDPEELGRNTPVSLGIEADARAGLAALAERVAAHNRQRPSREAELQNAQEAGQAKIDAVLPQAAYAHAIRAELPDDGIYVGEMTQIAYWSGIGFPVYEPRTYFTPGYQGTLGWGFPTSLGVKVGAPDKVVVSVNGDGGFGFALNELATQAHHGIASITLVFNDSAYGNVRRIQNVEFNGRTIASDLRNPDYVKLAESFGVTGRRATSPESLRAQLAEVDQGQRADPDRDPGRGDAGSVEDARRFARRSLVYHPTRAAGRWRSRLVLRFVDRNACLLVPDIGRQHTQVEQLAGKERIVGQNHLDRIRRGRPRRRKSR